MEYRYRDKTYLSNYMLDTNLFNQFDFLVEDAAPIRSIYVLSTNKGSKILKKIAYPIEELVFIYNSLKKISEKYPYVVNFKENIYGVPYVKYENGIYVVIDVIDGRECCFDNVVDLKNASSALAKLHIAGENIEYSCKSRNKCGKMIEQIQRHTLDMKKYKEIADIHVNKSDFDKLYLEYSDYYIYEAQKAADKLENSCYRSIAMAYHTLCHHDLAHHNVMIDKEGNVFFIDFDYCIIDLPYHDLCNMITKSIKHNLWDMDMTEVIIESYNEFKILAKEEMDVLLGYLMFPQDFYDIASSYYLRTRDWEEEDFVDKLKRRCEYKDLRIDFLKAFSKKYQANIL